MLSQKGGRHVRRTPSAKVRPGGGNTGLRIPWVRSAIRRRHLVQVIDNKWFLCEWISSHRFQLLKDVAATPNAVYYALEHI
jgi:hypothetical protein